MQPVVAVDWALGACLLARHAIGELPDLEAVAEFVPLGAPVFRYHVHADGPFLAAGTRLFQLDCDPAEVPLRTRSTIYGVHHLPVAW